MNELTHTHKSPSALTSSVSKVEETSGQVAPARSASCAISLAPLVWMIHWLLLSSLLLHAALQNFGQILISICGVGSRTFCITGQRSPVHFPTRGGLAEDSICILNPAGDTEQQANRHPRHWIALPGTPDILSLNSRPGPKSGHTN